MKPDELGQQNKNRIEHLQADLLTVIETLEELWLENEAARVLLEQHGIPDFERSIRRYAESPENQFRVRQRLVRVRFVLQSALQDSRVLETFGVQRQTEMPVV